MENYHDHDCGKIGRQTGLLCAALGVGVAAFIMVFTGLWWLIADFWAISAVIFGVIVLFLASGFWGTRAGVFLCWKGNRTPLAVLIGMALAFGSITIAVLAGAVFHIFFHDPNHIVEVSDFLYVLLTPLVFVLIFGGIPTAVLGVVYGLLVGMRLEK